MGQQCNVERLIGLGIAQRRLQQLYDSRDDTSLHRLGHSTQRIHLQGCRFNSNRSDNLCCFNRCFRKRCQIKQQCASLPLVRQSLPLVRHATRRESHCRNTTTNFQTEPGEKGHIFERWLGRQFLEPEGRLGIATDAWRVQPGLPLVDQRVLLNPRIL